MLGILAIGLLSIWIAKEIGSPVWGWAIGFTTANVFRFIDKALADWARRTPEA